MVTTKESAIMKTYSLATRIVGLLLIPITLILPVLSDKTSATPVALDAVSPLANQTWVRLGGPIGGLGYDIRMRSDSPDIMYVTDAWAGVHKSTDGGQTWFTLNNGITERTGPSGDAIPVFCLTIDPNNNNIIWIGLQNLGGVYRSEDGGQTWQERINGIVEGAGLTIRGFTIEPDNSNVVYAAGEISSWKWAGQNLWGREFDLVKGVVYKTTDGGQNWQAVWRGDNLARYVLIDPNNHNIVYISTGIFDREAANSDANTNAAGGEGVLKSIDGGQTWTHINNGLGNLYVGSLFMHPTNSNILLAGSGNNAYRDNGGVYRTSNGGASWQYVAGDHITSVEISLLNPNIAYAAGDGNFYKSQDGGVTWQLYVDSRGWGWGPKGIRPGFPIDFQVDPRDSNRIFVNNYGGGNFLSENGGQTWVSSSIGYTGADLRDVFVFPNNPAYVLANGRSGPFLSRDGGVNWLGINPLELRPIAEGARVKVDPSNAQHILLSSAHWGWTYESTDGGQSWELVTNYEQELQSLPVSDTNKKFQGFQAITFAPSNPNIVYGGFGIWRCATNADPDMCNASTIVSILLSQTGGHTWTRINGTPFDGRTVSEIVVHPTDPNKAWVATVGGGVFRTENLGQTWATVNSGLSSLKIMDLAGDPATPNILYAGSEDHGVFKSVNGGDSWNLISAGMDSNEPIHALVVDPVHPQVIYAGSYRSGVFISDDGGATWNLLNTGLHTHAVTSLTIDEDGETLYAGTTGEGVFRLSTHDQAYFNSFSTAPTDITISNSNIDENQPIGTIVGTLSTTDSDAGDTFTYSFCGGTNDTSFTITGSTLKTAAIFDYETKSTYSICIRSTDSGSLHFDKTFAINVNDLADSQTFSDVSISYWAWQFIERLSSAGITGGCGTSTYCPEDPVTRAQMAVFLERGMAYPSSFTPPDVPPTFTDTVGHWAEDWIEALKSDGITSGCAANLYCPEDLVTRAQMAVFLLKAKHGTAYVPPPATGIFADVPVGYWADKWIEQLALENITGGCATDLFCPNNPVTRAQMAVFLVKTFNLP
ncbi:MAG: hypothetical protein C3F07_19550 [Anaerolineales bacterium]|nr:MAG: hypothetical protein C3F07_19550 [Anaerolineales bacterium]